MVWCGPIVGPCGARCGDHGGLSTWQGRAIAVARRQLTGAISKGWIVCYDIYDR